MNYDELKKPCKAMKKSRVVVIYDRKKKVAKTGKGIVELRIYLNHKECKFITVGEITPAVWDEKYQAEGTNGSSVITFREEEIDVYLLR